MKALKITIPIIVILAFVTGTDNIVIEEISIQWFGFVSVAFLIWLYFSIERIIKKDLIKIRRLLLYYSFSIFSVVFYSILE